MPVLDVVIDGRALVGHRTGIGVHTAEIARRLAFDPPPRIAAHASIDDRQGLEGCRFDVRRAPNGLLWQQLRLPRIEGDVLWGPHGTLPLFSRRPSVVTIHDFTSLTMPGRHRLRTLISFNALIGRSLAAAKRVACVSRAVADEALRGFGVSPEKLVVVPNGVDEFFSPGGERGDYLLFAGTIEPRKGIADLLAVWRSLPQPRPRLVLCGDRGWGGVQTGDAEVTGYVSRERLRELYRGAMAFVYPSHEEGFGMPPLEAMACGTPVVATATGAIPDYAADGAAVLVAPGDRDALAAGLRRVLADRTLREELAARGLERASRWRWDASARTMTQLLLEAAS